MTLISDLVDSHELGPTLIFGSFVRKNVAPMIM